MKRSGMKAKYSPMEQANVYQVQFTTMPEDLLVRHSFILAIMVSHINF